MAKIRVNKVEAARRQINTAIRLLFDGGDPLAILTLASAGGRILRDLCEQKSTPLDQLVKDHIVPGMERKFWQAMNGPANFLKHANNDADALLDNVDEEFNDMTLFLACAYYRDLGHSLTREMLVLVTLVAVRHPHFLRPDAAAAMRDLTAHANAFRHLPRAEQLDIAKMLLASGW